MWLTGGSRPWRDGADVPGGDTIGKGKNRHRKFKEQPAGQRDWSPGVVDGGRAVGGTMQGLPSWLELYPECKGRAGAGKDLQQESEGTRLEFLTFWLRRGGCIRVREQ